MAWWIIVVEMCLFAAIVTAVDFAFYSGERKYLTGSIHNYPPDIQEVYFQTHERFDTSYRSKNVLLTKGFGILLFRGIFLSVRSWLVLERLDRAFCWLLA